MTLGNHADAFHLTPMRTSITKGGNSRMGRANYGAMPSPRGSGSSTQVVMAGMGDDYGAQQDNIAAGVTPDPNAPILGPPAPVTVAPLSSNKTLLAGGALAALVALWWFSKDKAGPAASAGPKRRRSGARRTRTYRRIRTRRAVRRDHRGRFLSHR